MKFLEEETLNFEETLKKHDIGIHYLALHVLDYIFFQIDDYQGIETHQLAAIEGMKKIALWRMLTRAKYLEIRRGSKQHFSNEELLKNWQHAYGTTIYSILPKLMKAERENLTDFFKEYPAKECYDYAKDKELVESYHHAFVDPPYGNSTGRKDFKKLNQLIFPNQQDLIIYRWNDDWSDYFDAGKEWWGTFYWTIYDPTSKRMTIIGGSATD
ncbi:hypothetical protein [Isobaculum melis]|uniref:DNA methylase n=1 Tax=Isobaculum melis TaxID=142588 RepID=A0A1H9QUQ8_9LACT|nr:hypothetical protein [Isobaculum melis]SER64212.1 hypothetical protein SAMN04488559_102299 [Isobaculum melis]